MEMKCAQRIARIFRMYVELIASNIPEMPGKPDVSSGRVSGCKDSRVLGMIRNVGTLGNG